MHDIQIDTHHYQLPGSWDELTTAQLEFLARTLAMPGVTMEQVKLYMTLFCLNAHVKEEDGSNVVQIDNSNYEIEAENMLPVQELFGYLFEDGKPIVRSALHVNPYPTLRIKGHELKGADDRLYTITFEQYIYLLTYLDAVCKDPGLLGKCLACVWHRGPEFDIDNLERDAELISRLDDDVKQVMLWYVQGSLDALQQKFARVYSGPSNLKVGNVLDAQLRLLDALADGDMTKKDLVRHGMLIDALYTLDESVRRKEDLDKKYQNRK